MGNSPSSGLGSGSAHSSRDVRSADPETEIERPPASPEPNRKSQEPNRKSPSTRELPASPKPYSMRLQVCGALLLVAPVVNPMTL